MRTSWSMRRGRIVGYSASGPRRSQTALTGEAISLNQPFTAAAVKP
jgi:hypothetical protein